MKMEGKRHIQSFNEHQENLNTQMKKCKCIKESEWFLIDDSFDKNSKLKGGQFSFQTGEIYEYNETESFFGRVYYVIHPIHGKENPTGFDENRFLEHFEIIN